MPASVPATPPACGTNGDGTDRFCVQAASTTWQYISLDPALRYNAVHDGEAVDGSTDNNTIYLGSGQQVTADGSAESGKYKLKTGGGINIGPGLSTLHFATAAGAPTFSISANELRR